MAEQFWFAMYVGNILSVTHLAICNYNVLVNFYVIRPFNFDILNAAKIIF